MFGGSATQKDETLGKENICDIRDITHNSGGIR